MKRIILLLIAVAGIAATAPAQNFVQGTVTDRSHEPMPGVRVSSTKKNGASTLTDLDGNFTLDERPRRIMAEYVGFITKRSNTKNNPTSIRMRRYKKVHYQGEVSLGYATNGSMSGLRSEEVGGIWNFSTIFIESVHGIRFGKYFFAGVGANAGLLKENIGFIGGPMLDVKGYLPIGNRFALYAAVDFGFNGIDVNMKRYSDRIFEPKGGLYRAYGIGLNYGHLNFQVGMRQLSINGNWSSSYEGETKITNMSTFFKVGVKF